MPWSSNMGGIIESSFIQKSQNIRENILLKLYDIYKSDNSLHTRRKSKFVSKLAIRGAYRIQTNFRKRTATRRMSKSRSFKTLILFRV